MESTRTVFLPYLEEVLPSSELPAHHEPLLAEPHSLPPANENPAAGFKKLSGIL
jgi:hypothetical protein